MKSEEHYGEADREIFDFLDAQLSDWMAEFLDTEWDYVTRKVDRDKMMSELGIAHGLFQSLALQKINWQLHRIASALEGMGSRP